MLKLYKQKQHSKLAFHLILTNILIYIILNKVLDCSVSRRWLLQLWRGKIESASKKRNGIQINGCQRLGTLIYTLSTNNSNTASQSFLEFHCVYSLICSSTKALTIFWIVRLLGTCGCSCDEERLSPPWNEKRKSQSVQVKSYIGITQLVD